MHRHLHNEILENTINKFVEENNRLEKKLKSRKIQLPIEQHKDLKEDKKHLIETIFKLKKEVFSHFLNINYILLFVIMFYCFYLFMGRYRQKKKIWKSKIRRLRRLIWSLKTWIEKFDIMCQLHCFLNG